MYLTSDFRDKVRQWTNDITSLRIEYGRPIMHGRPIFLIVAFRLISIRRNVKLYVVDKLSIENIFSSITDDGTLYNLQSWGEFSHRMSSGVQNI